MVKSTKIIATLGVAAGLSVALLPLASYAATEGTQVVKAEIGSTLALAVTNNTQWNNTTAKEVQALALNQNAFGDLTHTVNVSGNDYNGYYISMAADGGQTALRRKLSSGYDDNVKIASVTEETDLVAGLGKWGYKHAVQDHATTGDPTYSGNYLAIPAAHATGSSSAIENFANASHVAFNRDHYFNYGISTATDQVAGVYETTVEYKVVANL